MPGVPASLPSEPELPPELEPPLDPLLEPELPPELPPLLDPELPPELDPLLDPELLPELDPLLEPELLDDEGHGTTLPAAVDCARSATPSGVPTPVGPSQPHPAVQVTSCQVPVVSLVPAVTS